MTNESEDETERRTHERRENGRFTEAEIEAIKDAILSSIYEDIGRSLVKKILWATGAVLAAMLAWLAAKGYVK